MSEDYKVSFKLVNQSGEKYIFTTIKVNGAKTFRDFLSRGDRKLFGITERNELLSQKNTDINAQRLVEKYDIDLFSMSDVELKKIGLERFKEDKPETCSFVSKRMYKK